MFRIENILLLFASNLTWDRQIENNLGVLLHLRPLGESGPWTFSLYSVLKMHLLRSVSLVDRERLSHGLRSTVGDHDIPGGLVTRVSVGGLNLTNDVHTADHLSEDNVTSVQPAGLLRRDKELASVGVLSSVGHRQPTSAVVLQLKVLIGKAFSVD